jgi:quinol monooxygenase YgiN
MFARTVEITSKPGKARELSRTVNDKVMTILKNQPGFVDEVLLISAEQPDNVLAISIWNSREDAEKYNRESYSKVVDLLQPLSEGRPRVRNFDVEQSTIHKITAGKAA